MSNTGQAESGQRRPAHGLKQLTSCLEVGVASSNMKTLSIIIIESQQMASNIKENDLLLSKFSLMTSSRAAFDVVVIQKQEHVHFESDCACG